MFHCNDCDCYFEAEDEEPICPECGSEDVEDIEHMDRQELIEAIMEVLDSRDGYEYMKEILEDYNEIGESK